MDKTSFWYAGLCAICHPGGGFTEFDRDGQLYYDVATSQFGYEKLGKVAGDVTLDGDYAEVSNATGALRAAPWHITGVAEPDCLMCHRLDRTISSGKNMNWIWRTATLRAKDKLKDTSVAEASVPAYAAAATAGQGWFSGLGMGTVPAGKPPLATTLDIDYHVGVDNGSLLEDAQGILRINPQNIAGTPTDYACWGCHVTPDLKKRGRTWFTPSEDVHYAAFNKLDDADVANDVPALLSTACTKCHEAGMDHNIGKGNATLGSVRNDTDHVGFRTCRECHMPGPEKHPDAPAPQSEIHTVNSKHLQTMSCEVCHIPYKTGEADLAIDNATTGNTIAYKTRNLLSADPLDPSDPDKSKWYPSFVKKRDADGIWRLFPTKLLLSAWWGDWDDGGTPTDFHDDTIKPLPLWRVRQATGGAPLPGTQDDNGDGKVEVNTHAEILAYIAALRTGTDSYGTTFAARPVLVKGGHIWFESGMGGQVLSLDYEEVGIHTESSHPFSVNHNVRSPSEAWGANGACSDCHGSRQTPVFDRLIPVSPFDGTGSAQPRYKKVRDLIDVDPF